LTINKKPPIAWIVLTTSLFAYTALSASSAIAQVSADEVIDEVKVIVTIGTRRAGRTNINAAMPIDVFSREDLDSISSDDMLDTIEKLVPSFIVPLGGGDGGNFVRPALLRGLSADKVLVLVNGKRRHRSPLVKLSGDGAHGPDLATIPSIAVQSIEVLRDGASALYGSDAIAGVINYNLRNAADGGELRLQTGMYTAENESGYLLAFNQGFSFAGNGFINISAEISDNDETSRGTYYSRGGFTPVEVAQVSGFFDHDLNPATPDQERFGPDALTEIYDPSGALITIARGSDDIPDDIDTRYADNLRFASVSDNELVQIWGEPDRDAIRTFINAGFDLANGSQLYGWANYSDSNANVDFFHRPPDNSVLAPLRTENGEIYNPRSLYPASFTPRFAGNVVDLGLTGGIKGEFNNGMSYDFGGRWGKSTIKYTIYNTLNPSLGQATPTSFRPGDLVSDETAFNADFAIPIDVGFASDLNVAFGFEYRDEGYELVEGDLQSHEVGHYALPDPFNFEIDAEEAAAGQNGGSVGCFIPGPQFDPANLCHPEDPIHNAVAIGSNGFVGYGPETASAYNRDSWAVYLDLEADISDRFMASLAGRYEDFSDFGSNFSFRLATRLQVNDTVSLRASAGTGFRAPTPGQISSTSVQTGIVDGLPVARGHFPSEHPVAQFFGAAPLQAETSTQFTIGVAAQPNDAFTLTLDYYFIALDDRFWTSSNFDAGPAQDAGIPGAENIEAIKFFVNDLDTETSGLDLVASYNVDWSSGNTLFSIAANVNDSKVTRRTDRQTDPSDPTPEYFVRDSDVYRIEKGDPEFRAYVTARHSWADSFSASLRGSWFGDYQFSNSSFTRFETMKGKTFWDFDVTWDVNDALSVTLGGNNIFDEYPGPPPSFRTCCGEPVHTSTVMGWQGSYYYVRGAFMWN
jgi:iron complex outermembrane receptor protein